MSDTPLYFPYGQKEMEHLRRSDPDMCALVDRLGMIHRSVQPDLFEGLLVSIVSQQISGKAAETVWGRITERMGAATPANLLALDVPSLRACGVSERKAGYLRGIAEQAADGRLDFEEIRTQDDAHVRERLIQLPGIGPWTADMLLLFSLQRQDVLSWIDLGIRRGFSRLYGPERDTKDWFEDRRRVYSPYGSTASLYLWALSSEPDPKKEN